MSEPGSAARPPASIQLLAMLCVTMTVVVSAGTVINVGLPSVVAHFDATSIEASWLVLGYLLFNTSSLALFGKLADRVDRRRMFLADAATFTVCVLLAGFSPWVEVIIVLRSIQALGAAMMICNAAAILVAAFPRERLTMAMGYYIASVSVAHVVGPTIGGLVLAVLPWQWLFWVYAPLGAIITVWSARLLRSIPDRPPRGHRRLDVGGAVLLTILVAGTLLGLSSLQADGGSTPQALVCAAAVITAILLLVVVERRARDPLIDPAVIRNPYFTTLNAAGFVAIFPRWALLAVLPVYFQASLGLSPADAGLLVLSLPAMLAIGSLCANRIARAVGVDGGSAVGAAVTSLGLIPMLFLFQDPAQLPLLLLCQACIGFGGGLFASSNAAAIMSIARPDQLATFNGIRAMVQAIGGAVGTAIAFAVVTIRLDASQAAYYLSGAPTGVDDPLDALISVGYTALATVLLGASIASLILTLVARHLAAGGSAGEDSG